MSHTPGPWTFEVKPDNDNEGIIEGAGGASVCRFGDSQQYYPTAGTVPEPADLALILAAPELLEALEQLLPRADVYDSSRTLRAIESARAAIAKARGTK